MKHPQVFSLEQAYSEELRRMKSEWFFQWHFIGENRRIHIDRFDGGEIVFGGIQFDGSARDVYWDALRRYSAGFENAEFAKIAGTASELPADQRAVFVAQSTGLVQSFLRQIADYAVERDVILRSRNYQLSSGSSKPEPDYQHYDAIARTAELPKRIKSFEYFVLNPDQSKSSTLIVVIEWAKRFQPILWIIFGIIGAVAAFS